MGDGGGESEAAADVIPSGEGIDGKVSSSAAMMLILRRH